MDYETLKLLIASGIWFVLVVILSLMIFFQNKFQIKDQHISFLGEILKYVSGALIGFIVGAGIWEKD